MYIRCMVIQRVWTILCFPSLSLDPLPCESQHDIRIPFQERCPMFRNSSCSLGRFTKHEGLRGCTPIAERARLRVLAGQQGGNLTTISSLTHPLSLSLTNSLIHNNNESVNSEAAPRTRCCGANLEEKAGAGLHENSCSALNPHRPVSAANTTFPPSRDYTAGGGS